MRILTRLSICTLLLTACLQHASAQEWQSYQLTHFLPNRYVQQCGAVADSLGSVHCYAISYMAMPGGVPMYYLRTDFYGHILTDTVRINPMSPMSEPNFTSVVGDGGRSWCVWSDTPPGEPTNRAMFLAGRDAHGAQFLPQTLLGGGGASGPPNWDLAAALRPQDSTIHLVGQVGVYSYGRFTTAGDTIVWHEPIDGLTDGIGAAMAMGPDGVPWAAMRSGYSSIATEILLVRFGEDSSQTVYHPFGSEVQHWAISNMGIDQHYSFHLLVSCDTASLAYVRLDSDLTVQEWQTIDSTPWSGFAAMRCDPEGNCVFVWDRDPGLYWAYRSADGTWPHSPALIDPTMRASSFSVVAMSDEQFAFTTQAHPQAEYFSQLRLYTWGFPPDAASEPRTSLPRINLTAYPNPFGSTLTVTLPFGTAHELTLYDILGRVALTLSAPQNTSTFSVSDPRLTSLPSGTYFLTLRGNNQVVPTQIIHFK